MGTCKAFVCSTKLDVVQRGFTGVSGVSVQTGVCAGGVQTGVCAGSAQTWVCDAIVLRQDRGLFW